MDVYLRIDYNLTIYMCRAVPGGPGLSRAVPGGPKRSRAVFSRAPAIDKEALDGNLRHFPALSAVRSATTRPQRPMESLI
jgi:hypothetical protein